MSHLSDLLNHAIGQLRQQGTVDMSLCEAVLAWERRTPERSQALGLTSSETVEGIQERLGQLAEVLDELLAGLPLQGQERVLENLWRLWLPLARQLAQVRRESSRPIVQGILGGQGTGKTTLARALSVILGHLGYRTLGLSLDDLYKSHAERQRLKADDPRLVRRGPPGTHDVELGLQVLQQLRRGESPVAIPRFDKSAFAGDGDRMAPEEVEGADIILFEGWFVGVEPIDASCFERPPAPICTAEDKAFARDCNQRLAEYLPLWDCCDRLMVLFPVDYRLSQRWRLQAEHDAIAQGKAGLSDEEIREFVEYFWKALHPELFITPLIAPEAKSALVVTLEADHGIGSIR
ncbi:glycerate kinase [Geitlerinema sp. P-1104]|uniref:glycerate kinase n=1 Tax=Geitlerinema sp. P-1104 TaxID=2546230 RepID=UPI00197FB8AA|nr:glycerate kinase [Geitlerinema sp. P-1104]